MCKHTHLLRPHIHLYHHIVVGGRALRPFLIIPLFWCQLCQPLTTVKHLQEESCVETYYCHNTINSELNAVASATSELFYQSSNQYITASTISIN